jgi:hypothetical protein
MGQKKLALTIFISFPYLPCSLSSLLSCAVKWPQHEADILVFPSAGVHNAWGFTCVSLYTFLAGCLVVDNFKVSARQYKSMFTKLVRDKNILTIHTLTKTKSESGVFHF